MGHEVAGSVAGVGPGVDPALEGRRVVVFPLLTCGTCPWCQGGSEQLCAERSYIGIHHDGGFAEQVLVPAANLVPIPEGLDAATASLAEPAAVAVHAVNRAPDLTGASVLVTGAGPIGLLIAQAARHAGGAVGVTSTEISPERRRMAADLGLETIDPAAEGWLEELRAATDGGVDVAFEAVGVQATFEAAVDAVRTRGCVVLAAGWQTILVALGDLVTREVETRGTFNFSRAEFDSALALLGRVDGSALVSDRVPLTDAAAAFARLATDQGASMKTAVVP
jgi:L-idonate 5-dehydrogenase